MMSRTASAFGTLAVTVLVAPWTLCPALDRTSSEPRSQALSFSGSSSRLYGLSACPCRSRVARADAGKRRVLLSRGLFPYFRHRSGELCFATLGTSPLCSEGRSSAPLDKTSLRASLGRKRVCIGMVAEKQGARTSAGVSGALNRALGNILSTGDKLASNDASIKRGKNPSDSGPKAEAAALLGSVHDEDENDDEDDEEDEKDEKDIEGGQWAGTGDGDGRLQQWRRIGQRRRSAHTGNRLLRARTEANAAIVVDGPFSKLESYMTLPVSEYSLLDSSVIQRLSEKAFRLQIPLSDFGLDFTPSIEVEVDLDETAKRVVFRSTRSTLYGKVGNPGDEATADPWPDADASRIEYFRVGFNARLQWVDGDASRQARQRVRGRFTGDFTRYPRPPPTRTSLLPEDEPRSPRAGSSVPAAGRSPAASEMEAAQEVPVEPATVFCESGVRVHVLLPPPYNAVLPWRLLRALLGKVLSTTVRYMLPKFLELLADDFYRWQSGSRRDDRLTGNEGGLVARNGAGKGMMPANDTNDVGGNRSRPNANPVVGGFQRLRNVRGPTIPSLGSGAGAGTAGTAGTALRSEAASTVTTAAPEESDDAAREWSAQAIDNVGSATEGVSEEEGEGKDTSGQPESFRRPPTRRGWGPRGGFGGGSGNGPLQWWG